MPISIIVPSTGSRTTILIDTLRAALRALDGVEGEVIVIKKADKQIALTDPRLRLIDVEFNNVSASRNLGAKLATHELLLFIDDDIEVSAANVQRILAVDAQLSHPYLVTTIWQHSARVEKLKTDTFLGQMLAQYYPDDSFETRYKKVSGGEWEAGRLFKSSMTRSFWEFGFMMRKTDYLRIGGMNEQFDFGDEGIDFLERALATGITYYVDAANLVVHNEWDKFDDWSVPEKRWRLEAQLVNDGRRALPANSKNYLYKLLYGGLLYLPSPLIGSYLHRLPAQPTQGGRHFKLFDIYMTSLYWAQMKWSTLRKR